MLKMCTPAIESSYESELGVDIRFPCSRWVHIEGGGQKWQKWSILTDLMLVYGGEVIRGPPDLLQMASVQYRCQGTNWLRRVVLEVDLFECIGTSKVRNLGCGIDGQVLLLSFWLLEMLLIQVGLAIMMSHWMSQVPYFLVWKWDFEGRYNSRSRFQYDLCRF